MTEHDDDPFPQAEVGAIMRASERPVCGGWTQLEWNQQGGTDVAFSCTHGTCQWRIVIGDTLRFGLVMLAEAQHADRLHREHAWRFLDAQTTDPAQ